MVKLVNQVRTNPKSFIPLVEKYLKDKEEFINKPFIVDLPDGFTVTKRSKTITNDEYIITLRNEVKDLIDYLNTVKPVKALATSEKLYRTSKMQVEYLKSIKKLTHDGPNGESASKRFSHGVILCGENCATGQTAIYALLALLIDSGNNPKGHRINIFLEKFTKIGVGNENEYWVQDFGY